MEPAKEERACRSTVTGRNPSDQVFLMQDDDTGRVQRCSVHSCHGTVKPVILAIGNGIRSLGVYEYTRKF